MRLVMTVCLALVLSACVQTAEQDPNLPRLNVSFADDRWIGGVPAEELCKMLNPAKRPGNSPSIKVAGIPASAVTIELSFNGTSNRNPTAFINGGHGVIHYQIPNAGAGEVIVPSFPGQTDKLAAGFVVKRDYSPASSETFGRKGYLPPCSQGSGNRYSVDIRALDAQGARVAAGYLFMGTP